MTDTATQKSAAGSTLDLQRVSGHIGAEVRGLALSGTMAQDDVDAIWAALNTHKVLFFRSQHHLDDAEHQAFAARMGPVMTHPTLTKEQAAKGPVLAMDSAEPGGRSDNWHTDGTFMAAPPKASILRGLVFPNHGGDTAWINTARAYETLTPALKALADGLRALHSNEMTLATKPTLFSDERFLDFKPLRPFVAEHPVVAVHPETGERTLQLGYFVQRLLDYDRWDSARLIDFLQRHIERMEHMVRWRWQPGDVIIWDNRATQHYAVNDYGDQPRHVRRITVEGTPMVGVDGRTSMQRVDPENPALRRGPGEK
jgi:alpha-ketoglutarate-dependent taurine dioxygenase